MREFLRFIFWMLVGVIGLLLFPIWATLDAISEKLTKRAIFMHGPIYGGDDATWLSKIRGLI